MPQASSSSCRAFGATGIRERAPRGRGIPMISLAPPVRIPVQLGELLGAMPRSALPPQREFSEALATATGYRYAEFFESGRAALTALLRAWAVPGRDEVVVPAYTCWSVPASIVQAGLKVRLIDVDPHTLDRAETA